MNNSETLRQLAETKPCYDSRILTCRDALAARCKCFITKRTIGHLYNLSSIAILIQQTLCLQISNTTIFLSLNNPLITFKKNLTILLRHSTSYK